MYKMIAIVPLLCLVLLTCKDKGTEPLPLGWDTTSHNFTFTLDTLGDGNSSVLYDCTIINDTLAYVVGEIYAKDSTGQFNDPAFNAARWNGLTWKLLRIAVRDFGGATGYYPLKTVFGFSPTNVWFASDADLIQWDGNSFVAKAFFMTSVPFAGQVIKMWGNEEGKDLWLVGRGGSIYHYSGGAWGKLESGTTLAIQDIWGERNSITGQLEILALASNKLSLPVGKKLLRIQGTTVATVSDSGLSLSLSGLWFDSNKRYFIVGDAIYYSQNLNSSTVWSGGTNTVTTFYTNAVRGNSPNDLFVVGSFGEVLHFNGSSWRSFHEQTAIASGSYWSVSMRGTVVVAVGDEGDRAIIARGRR